MLSGLFKRKDKKTKAGDDEIEEEKFSLESSRSSPPPKPSLESLSPEQQKGQGPQPQKQQPGRLQKQPPVIMSPTRDDSEPTAPEAPSENDDTGAMASHPENQSIRRVISDENGLTNSAPRETMSPTASSSPSKDPTPPQPRSMASPTDPSTREVSQGEGQGSYDRGLGKSNVMSPPQRFQPRLATDYQARGMESPVNVSPLEGQTSTGSPGLGRDDSSTGKHYISPMSPSQSPNADLRDAEVESVSEAPTWSDASLRSYLDEHSDIHDLFVIVHDKSNVPPAGPDHPITGSLFKDESRRLKEMTSALDEMLVDWIGRRMQSSTLK